MLPLTENGREGSPELVTAGAEIPPRAPAAEPEEAAGEDDAAALAFVAVAFADVFAESLDTADPPDADPEPDPDVDPEPEAALPPTVNF